MVLMSCGSVKTEKRQIARQQSQKAIDPNKKRHAVPLKGMILGDKISVFAIMDA